MLRKAKKNSTVAYYKETISGKNKSICEDEMNIF